MGITTNESGSINSKYKRTSPVAGCGRFVLAALAVAACAGVGAGSAMGAGVWTGATNSDWNTGTNWDNNAVPTGGNVTFQTGTPSSVTLSAATSANNIFFASNSGDYTIGAVGGTNSISMNNNAAIQISAPSNAHVTFNTPVTFSGGGPRITNNSTTGGSFTFNGPIQMDAGVTTLALQSAVGGGTNYLNGEISGAGTLSRSGAVGQGAYVISHSNPNFTGIVSVRYSAPLILTNSGAMTNASLAFGYLGNLSLRSDTSATFGTAGITMTGQSAVDVGQLTSGHGGKTLTLGGDISMDNNTGFSVSDSSGSDDTLALGDVKFTATGTGYFAPSSGHVTVGDITGGAPATKSNALTLRGTTDNNRVAGIIGDGVAGGNIALSKSESGTWYLDGDNTYTGATSITAGALYVNGTTSGQGNFSANSGTTLGGDGTIGLGSGTGSVSVSGKLDPGAQAGATGTLTVDTGNLTITNALNAANSQNLLFDLGSIASSDKVVVTDGVLAIGASKLDFGDFVFTAGPGLQNGVYTLFDTNATISGTLAGGIQSGAIGIDGAQGVLSILNNQDVILTVSGVVPEPATLGLIAFGALGLLARRRRMA